MNQIMGSSLTLIRLDDKRKKKQEENGYQSQWQVAVDSTIRQAVSVSQERALKEN